jgi:hypothetical protein
MNQPIRVMTLDDLLQPAESQKPEPLPCMRLDVFLERHPEIWATEQAARWAIRNAESNGLFASGAARKREGRWFIFPALVVEWIRQGEGAG